MFGVKCSKSNQSHLNLIKKTFIFQKSIQLRNQHNYAVAMGIEWTTHIISNYMIVFTFAVQAVMAALN